MISSGAVMIKDIKKGRQQPFQNKKKLFFTNDKIRFEWVDIIYDMSKARHLYCSVSLITFIILSENRPAL